MNETFLIIDGAPLHSPDFDWTGQSGAHSCPLTFRLGDFAERRFDKQLAANGWLVFHGTVSCWINAGRLTHTSLSPPKVFHKSRCYRGLRMGFKIKKRFTKVYTDVMLTWRNWCREPHRTEKFITLQLWAKFVLLNQRILLETVSKYANESLWKFAMVITKMFPEFMFMKVTGPRVYAHDKSPFRIRTACTV